MCSVVVIGCFFSLVTITSSTLIIVVAVEYGAVSRRQLPYASSPPPRFRTFMDIDCSHPATVCNRRWIPAQDLRWLFTSLQSGRPLLLGVISLAPCSATGELGFALKITLHLYILRRKSLFDFFWPRFSIPSSVAADVKVYQSKCRAPPCPLSPSVPLAAGTASRVNGSRPVL